MGLLVDFWTAFLLGLATPLTAVCVLPLYPGFLSFLASQVSEKENKKNILLANSESHRFAIDFYRSKQRKTSLGKRTSWPLYFRTPSRRIPWNIREDRDTD